MIFVATEKRSERMETYFEEVVEQIAVQRQKKVESAILGTITQIIEDNKVFTTVELNEDAIVKALQKQIPKNPIKKNPIVYQKDKDGQEHYAYDNHCPLCDKKLKFSEHHCPCGQAIDWSE